jgi:putative oxidoreductase
MTIARIRALLRAPVLGAPGSVALLALRLIAGLAFMFHDWPKIQAPFSWMGADSGWPAPLLLLAALSEFGGGLCWVLGLLTPLASLGILCTMSVAAYLHAFQFGDPFVNMQGGRSYEMALLFWGIALVLLTLGPGRFSADARVFGKR